MKTASAAVLALAVAGCAPSDSINADGDVFAAIGPDEAISVGGTEPFWAIAIKPDGQGGYSARYSTPDSPEGETFALSRFAGNNGLGFNGELGGQAVQIAITPGDCSDGMSDTTYPFAATVGLGEATLFGCAHSDSNPVSGEANP
ncbi:MAG: hypothetical protein SXU28_07545 [Pseudomonadota bacterium]|nr:hypothetical protein [Pseudomonadota bacterium]